MGRNSGGVKSGMSPTELSTHIKSSQRAMLSSGGGKEESAAFSKVVDAMTMANRKSMLSSLKKKVDALLKDYGQKARNQKLWQKRVDGHDAMIAILERKTKTKKK